MLFLWLLNFWVREFFPPQTPRSPPRPRWEKKKKKNNYRKNVCMSVKKVTLHNKALFSDLEVRLNANSADRATSTTKPSPSFD